jgi:FtsP/CotA-like multicopper oxidase with cupredoxin domain
MKTMKLAFIMLFAGYAFAQMTMPMPGSTPDYFGATPNYANSPLPPVVTITDAGTGVGATAVATVKGGVITSILVTNGGAGYTAPIVTITAMDGTGATASAAVSGGIITTVSVTNGGTGYTGIRKFVDGLPGLGAASANNLGQYLPVAIPDPFSYPGSDYYVIELGQYTEKMHSDLPPTTLRGYRQTNTSDPTISKFHYLGPLIIASKDRPVRIKFINNLPTGAGGNLFIPTDVTMMGAGMGPNGGMEMYTQNRATLHLHGGATPWISDGTMHQWTTPAGEATSYPQGVSVKNVPDMDGGNEPQGTLTFYYTNQQSARLMFYHDHAYGITRLNVYAGEAAGYLLSDPAEQSLVTNGIIPSEQIPLIIQDKTFVPGPKQMAAQDPTWNWGSMPGMYMMGDLWFPHVYMPNQNPWDISGANAMGRWDYGPWFWPPFTGIANGPLPNPYYDPVNAPWEPPQIPGMPNPSSVMEGFMDVPVVNGTVFPTMTVEPKPYRLRILNASNDRMWNLSIYQATSNNPMWDANGNLLDPNAGEVTMVPATLNPLIPFPVDWKTASDGPGIRPDILDGRLMGVPDPRFMGPSWIQIGNEGGFLPTPVTIDPKPTGYQYNLRNITVLNVTKHSLFLGPAERADVIVDFSLFAGKTLILYNDGPAPVPAGDPRLDYYTGSLDLTATGGAPSIQPGYGPNTRTLLQIKVGTAVSTPSAPNLGQLATALPAAYAQYQSKPIIPQSGYNAAFNASYPVDNFVRIQDVSKSFFNGPLTGISLTTGGAYSLAPTVVISGGGGTGATATAALGGRAVVSVALNNGGSGYRTVPTVTFSGGGGTGATARATVVNRVVTAISLLNGGSGYTSRPTVAITGGGGTGARATASIAATAPIVVTLTNGGSGYTSAPAVSFTGGIGVGAFASAVGITKNFEPKAIQELFDPDYGRMNALLGVEIPNTTMINQTTIPFIDIDPPTEIFKAVSAADATATPIGTAADNTQIWKITHNGVDTHAIHWHMFNVQLINRVGWDGAIRGPEPNELGWKETIRMNPLEDAIVALRPIKPDIPWDLPNSIRPLDPTMPIGSTLNFSNVDPTNQPAAVTNQIVNYGWEYVWHCHLLGHEECVMMRPMVCGVAPNAPSNLISPQNGRLTWTDNSLNETGFTVQRATSATGSWATIGTVPGVTGSGGTVTYNSIQNVKKGFFFRVIANNVVGFTKKYAAPAVGYPNMSVDSPPSNIAAR